MVVTKFVFTTKTIIFILILFFFNISRTLKKNTSSHEVKQLFSFLFALESSSYFKHICNIFSIPYYC